MAAKDVERAYDAHAVNYDSCFSAPWAEAENRLIFRLVDAVGAGTGRILDIGCGTGLALEHLKPLPDNYCGIDVSGEMLKVASTRYPLFDFKHLDAEQLADRVPWPAFNSVISIFGPPSYCPNPSKLVTGIARAIVPGGRIFIMALAPGHRREPPVPESAPWTPMTCAELASLFRGPFETIVTMPWRWLPSRALDVMSYKEAEFALSTEFKYLRHVAPNHAYYSILTATRRRDG